MKEKRVLLIYILVSVFAQLSLGQTFNANFDTGIEGNTVTEFAQPINSSIGTIVYTSEISGPFGGNNVLKLENTITRKYFGGRIIDLNLNSGDQVWVRWYQYFPHGFAFANGVNGDGGGSAGMIKWLRFQYPGNSERITFEIAATPGCSGPCTNYLSVMTPETLIGESMSWRERYGNQAVFLSRNNPDIVSIPTGQWHAIQVYMKLSTGSDDQGDGDGIIRLWVDDKLIAEQQRNTLPTNEGALSSIHLGNYWNGGFPKEQYWYIDELVVTSEEPTATDENGNHYIDPKTFDVKTTPTPTYPPMAPTNLTIGE